MKQFEQVRGKILDMLQDLDASLGQVTADIQPDEWSIAHEKDSAASGAKQVNCQPELNTELSEAAQANSPMLDAKNYCAFCGNVFTKARDEPQDVLPTCPSCKIILSKN